LSVCSSSRIASRCSSSASSWRSSNGRRSTP
jgi:hypothetical protein